MAPGKRHRKSNLSSEASGEGGVEWSHGTDGILCCQHWGEDTPSSLKHTTDSQHNHARCWEEEDRVIIQKLRLLFWSHIFDQHAWPDQHASENCFGRALTQTLKPASQDAI